MAMSRPHTMLSFFAIYITDKLNDIVFVDDIQPHSVASFRLITSQIGTAPTQRSDISHRGL